MKLSLLFPDSAIKDDIIISSLVNDSRYADEGSLFIAYAGFEVNVHNYIPDAYYNGCRYFVVQSEYLDQFQNKFPDAFFFAASNIKQERARIAGLYYDYPDKKLKIIGITGTNGKTTTASLINQTLKKVGYKTAFFGTIQWTIDDEEFPALNTTPDLLALLKFMHQAVQKNVTHVVMEAASHALSMGRLEEIQFDAAVFTNLTQDHLDYHGDLENYFLAKASLFTSLLANSQKHAKKAFINIDDIYGQKLLAILDERGISSESLSIQGLGAWNASDIQLSAESTHFVLSFQDQKIIVNTALIGMINVQNTSMAYAVLQFLGVSQEDILSAFQEISIPGRFQKIKSPDGITFLIDYAHTPDALQKAVEIVNHILPEENTSIVVFGAGGDRDPQKRPMMAEACTKAGIIVVTSDNPRTESPQKIIDDIMRGCAPDRVVYQEIDRACAIQKAYDLAKSGDIILIAGKGHEEYQIIGDQKIYFSDIDQVRKICGLVF